MYLVTKRCSDIYSILDTSDMKEESITRDEVYSLLLQGTKIYGVSTFSIENDIPLRLILRFYGEDKEVKDFDGFLLKDYNSDLSEFTTQVIDCYTEMDALLDLNVFKAVINTLSKLNSSPYNLSSLNNMDLPIGYQVYAYNKEYLTLKDLSDGNLYKCDFYLCLYIYLEEGRRIDGISEITLDYLVYNDTVLRAYDVLEKYWSCSQKCNYMDKTTHSLVMKNTDFIDDIDCSYNDLDSIFSGSSMMLLSEIYFPVYNLSSVKRRINSNADIRPWFNSFGKPISLTKDGVLIFDDGLELSNFRTICKYFRVFDFDAELRTQVYAYIKGQLAKETLFNRPNHIESDIKSSFNSIGDTIKKMPSLLVDNGISYKDYAIRTPFGCIDIRFENPCMDKYSDKIFRTFWMGRLTHTGSAWYDMQEHEVVVGAMKNTESLTYSCIASEVFEEYYNKAVIDGLAYHNNKILPICVNRVEVIEDYVYIFVVCMTASSDGEDFGTTMFNAIEVPLIFLGGKFVEYDDCYKYYTLFNTIILEKKLVNYLYASYSVSDLYNLWGGLTSRKAGKTLADRTFKIMKRVMREAADL